MFLNAIFDRQNINLSKKQNEIELLKGKIQYQLGNKNIALGHFEKYKGDVLVLKDDELYQFLIIRLHLSGKC